MHLKISALASAKGIHACPLWVHRFALPSSRRENGSWGFSGPHAALGPKRAKTPAAATMMVCHFLLHQGSVGQLQHTLIRCIFSYPRLLEPALHGKSYNFGTEPHGQHAGIQVSGLALWANVDVRMIIICRAR